jgi:hypothetical protein
MSAAPANAPHRGYKRSQPAPLKVVPPRIRFARKRKSYEQLADPIRKSPWAPMAPVPTRCIPDFFRVTGSGCTGGLMAMIAHHTFAQPHTSEKPWTAPEWTEPMSDEEWGKLAGNFSRDQAHDSIAYAIQIGMLQRRSEVDAGAPKEAYFQYRWTPGLVWKDLPSAFTARVEKKPPASEKQGEEKATLSGIGLPLTFDKSFKINKAVEASWPETIGSGIAAKLKRPPEDLTVTASDPGAQVSTLQIARKLYVHVILPAPASGTVGSPGKGHPAEAQPDASLLASHLTRSASGACATSASAQTTGPQASQGAGCSLKATSNSPLTSEKGEEPANSNPAAGVGSASESAAGAGPSEVRKSQPAAAESLTDSPHQSPRPAAGINVVSSKTGEVLRGAAPFASHPEWLSMSNFASGMATSKGKPMPVYLDERAASELMRPLESPLAFYFEIVQPKLNAAYRRGDVASPGLMRCWVDDANERWRVPSIRKAWEARQARGTATGQPRSPRLKCGACGCTTGWLSPDGHCDDCHQRRAG